MFEFLKFQKVCFLFFLKLFKFFELLNFWIFEKARFLNFWTFDFANSWNSYSTRFSVARSRAGNTGGKYKILKKSKENLWICEESIYSSTSTAKPTANFAEANQIIIGSTSPNRFLLHFSVFLVFASNIFGSLARSPSYYVALAQTWKFKKSKNQKNGFSKNRKTKNLWFSKNQKIKHSIIQRFWKFQKIKKSKNPGLRVRV